MTETRRAGANGHDAAVAPIRAEAFLAVSSRGDRIDGQQTIVVFRKGEKWFASAPAFQIVVSGRGPDAARARLRDAVDVWLQICIREKRLEGALRELGWRRIERRWSAEPIVEPAKGQRMTTFAPVGITAPVRHGELAASAR